MQLASGVSAPRLYMREPPMEMIIWWEARKVYDQNGLTHQNLGDSFQAWCSSREELRRDMTADSLVRPAKY